MIEPTGSGADDLVLVAGHALTLQHGGATLSWPGGASTIHITNSELPRVLALLSLFTEPCSIESATSAVGSSGIRELIEELVESRLLRRSAERAIPGAEVLSDIHRPIRRTERALAALGTDAAPLAASIGAAETLMTASSTLRALSERIADHARRRSEATVLHLVGDSDRLNVSLGSGPGAADGWLSLDLTDGDVGADLVDGIPLRDHSVERLYCAHFLEHLFHPVETDSFLRECRRVLRPGAVARFAVPNVRHEMEAYVRRDRDRLDARFRALFGAEPTGPHLEHLLHYLGVPYVDEHQLLAHKYAFDEEVICALLARSGFVDVRIETYQTGRDPELLIDDTSLSASAHGGAWSLFVEAASPAPSARAGRRSGEDR